MKHIYRLAALTTAVALGATACSSGSDDEETPEASSSAAAVGADAEPLKVAVVAPSASNDLAFTQSMIDSLNAIGEERELDVDVTDGVFVVEDAAAAIRGYAEDGYDLVLAHGSQYGSSVQEIAAEFPDVAFAWGTAADTFDLPNVSSYTVRSDEGGYAFGVMAAALSESGTLGVIGPVEVGDAKLYVDGFVAGASAQDPSIATNVTYTDSFSDVKLAGEAATAHLSNGADVLTGSAQMVVGATGVAVEAGVPWFGTQSDQTSLGPDIVVASQVYDWTPFLGELFDSIEGGDLGGEVYTATLENGGLSIAYNDGFDLPADVKELGDTAIAGLTDGSVTTGIE
ncbi:BMP family protein [Demequina sp. NBRC 110057]|uniref:BMP family protein n=1 Tax=Demequina sp. NBRC 110057 TaxID=1570346 RepID=UPI001177E57B|nr:BMP family protein [Demequina sp. NBRC 110057]